MANQKNRRGKASGSKGMAKENRSLLESLDPSKLLVETRKLAAWSIDASEKAAHEALDFQARTTSWAKETPLAPVFELQRTVAKRIVDRSANLARTLWQIDKGASA
jgi:hypothetical protein